jgi:L-fuconolactonase
MHSTNRRQFLASSVAAAGAAVATKYAFAADSAKSFPKIDCHTHFWDHDSKGAALPASMMPKDLEAVALPLGVTGTVVVEASAVVEDNQWLLDLAKDDPYIVGVVGNLSPGKEEFAKHLERFAKNKLFRGIRVNAPLADRLNDQVFLDDVKRLTDLDLELDVNGGPDMPAEVARLAEKVPTLRIVVNHAANQDVDGKAPPEKWVTNMKAAAAHPQVFCKVSALVDQGGWQGGKAPTDLAIYKPMLDACWEIWGEDRVIYGSNWPVSDQFAPYKVVIGIVEQYLKDKSPAVQEKYFVLNSIKAYKWSPR